MAPDALSSTCECQEPAGWTCLKTWLHAARRTPVIFITAYADVPMAVRAMKSGAVEFVEKPFNRQTLLDKVQHAIRDDSIRRSRLEASERVQAKLARLTAKEREALELIEAGRPIKEIATRLNITPRAVEMRLSSLMKKLDVGSLVGLLRCTITQTVTHEHGRQPRAETIGRN